MGEDEYESALGDAFFGSGFLLIGEDTGIEDALSLKAIKEGMSISARDGRLFLLLLLLLLAPSNGRY